MTIMKKLKVPSRQLAVRKILNSELFPKPVHHRSSLNLNFITSTEMKKALIITLSIICLVFAAYYAFIYYVPYSSGVRSGELIKISHKGMLIKTWEGEISQGISGAQIFSFSVLDKDTEAIEKLKEYQGKYVRLDYIERYTTFAWLGDTKYFVTKVTLDKSPHFGN